jgi:molybdate-binding protein/DNA-binding transcriptional regulator YhcF (GntR family)
MAASSTLTPPGGDETTHGMIQVDLFSDVPIYRQIIEQMRLSIAEGRLKPGDRLEPVRQLAHRLRINPSTVARAYQLLEYDGIIETNRRRGSVIARSGDALANPAGGAAARDASLSASEAGLQSANSTGLHEAWQAIRRNRLRGIIERPLVEALAQGYSAEEIQAAFDLQLAAWRERRQQALLPRSKTSENVHGVRFAGSHDLALETLWAQARRVHLDLAITASYVGSLDGLLALLRGEANLAGTHILDEETGQFNLPILRRLFLGQPLRVVTLAEREQGLIVSRGNPLGLRSWADLARPGLQFANRQPGSGTRTLLDYHLRLEQISPRHLAGYGSAAATHLAVAAAVADGQADVGLGLYAAARAYGLDFVPLARERFDLVLFADDRVYPPLSSVLEILQTAEFRAIAARLGGYDLQQMGEETCI